MGDAEEIYEDEDDEEVDDEMVVSPKRVDVEELEFGALDHIAQRFHRVDGFRTVMELDLFHQCSEVARLAVELARLDLAQNAGGKVKASDFLASAAGLIQDSAAHIAVHPQKEKEENEKRFMAKITGKRVSLERIVGPGSKGVKVMLKKGHPFEFPPFASERGFVGFITSHFIRLVTETIGKERSIDGKTSSTRSQLIAHLTNRKSGASGAAAFLRRGYYKDRADLITEAVKAVGKGRGKKWAERIVNCWVELAAKTIAKELLIEWKQGGIPPVDMHSLAKSKALSNKAKGRKQSGKNKSEGTGSKHEGSD